jgi:hypothetical protein
MTCWGFLPRFYPEPSWQKGLSYLPFAAAAWNFYFAYWCFRYGSRQRKSPGFDVLPPSRNP